MEEKYRPCLALESLAAQPPDKHFDVVISDIAIPDEDGYAVIRKVRALPPDKGGTIPAIALTAYGGPEYRTRALEAGFQMHVVKPVDPDQLALAIQINQSRLIRGQTSAAPNFPVADVFRKSGAADV